MSKQGFLSVNESAKFLSVSIPSVMEFLEKGKLTFIVDKMDRAPFRNIRYIPISELEKLQSERSSFGSPPDGYVTCETAANLFGLHNTTIRFMAYDGRINSVKITGKHGRPAIYVQKESLENYIKERTASSELIDRFSVADLLGVEPGTVQKWARRNRIPFVRVKRLGGEHRLYPKDEIERLVHLASETPDLPDDFGYYLSGLTDGEGSFRLSVRNKQQTIQNEASFTISFRDDDLPILVTIRNVLGFGSLYFSHNGQRKPTARLDFSRHSDAIRLVHIFDLYPLRAKKARDYAVWREFVLERSKPDRSQERLNQLADEIVKVREYQSPTPELISEAKRLNDELPFHFKSLGTGVHS